MNRAAYVMPLTDDDEAALMTYSKDELVYLEAVFKHPTFQKAIRRANLAKPDATPYSGEHGALKKLSEIKGWEYFEKILFSSFKAEDLKPMDGYLDDDYAPENNIITENEE